MSRSRLRRAAGAAALVLAAGCSGADAAPAGQTHEVRMILEGGSARFEPASLTIRAGDSVRFVNVAGGPHNVTFDPATVPDRVEPVLSAAMPGQIQPLAGPLVVEPNGTYTISFAGIEPGRYDYFCLPHRGMGMTGAIVVQAAEGAAAPRAPGASRAAAPAPAAADSAAAPQAGIRLGVATSARYGPYLTDASGRALYLLEHATRCEGACMTVWPPLFAGPAGAVSGDPAVQPGRIGTVRRPDGATQVTYGGHPLYYYVADRGPGETLGQHVEDAWGEWYLVSPSGRHVEEPRGDEDRRGRRGRDRGEDRP